MSRVRCMHAMYLERGAVYVYIVPRIAATAIARFDPCHLPVALDRTAHTATRPARADATESAAAIYIQSLTSAYMRLANTRMPC
jgi:hypothetical protein